MERKLGFGLMRLPLLNPDDEGSVDVELCKKMFDSFIDHGFTYFDTALMYCGAKSESAVRQALTSRHNRDTYTLTTKLHCMYLKKMEDRDSIFNHQLEKTGVDYFDYYLIHDIGMDSYKTYTEFDCFNWLIGKKKQGLVKTIGFSFHDNSELLDKVLTEHPEMEFVQLQLNYLDWESVAIQSHRCYDVCVKHGKPVFVMEPVKGGTLANVPESVAKMFRDYNPEMSVPSWAVRFAASHPNVKIVLSGMSDMAQLEDNMSYMSDFKPFNDDEFELVRRAAEEINSTIAITCTGCSYCTGGCPQHIAIPRYFALYNADRQEVASKGWTPQSEYYDRLTHTFGKAGDCIQCGQCETACPQHLPIIENLKEVARYFGK